MEEQYIVEMFSTEFTVDPVAFSIGDFQIYWYGILIALGFLGALIYAFRRTADFKIALDPMIDVVLAGAVGGIIGARLYYVVMQWDTFRANPISIFDIRTGGLAIYGGLIGALLFGGLMCKIRKINLLSMFDLTGIGFLFGQAVGRWGNFVNQEAFGSNTTLPWGMFSSQTYQQLLESQDTLLAQGVTVDPTLPVHPCFLYESLWCILGFVLLHFYSKHRRFKGEVFLSYLVWYGLGRFFIEGLRTDSLMLGNIRISQLVAAVCVVGGIVALLILRSKYKEEREEGPYQPVYAGEGLFSEEEVQTQEDPSDHLPQAEQSEERIDQLQQPLQEGEEHGTDH